MEHITIEKLPIDNSTPLIENYQITFPSGKIINTTITPQLKLDFELFGTIPENASPEEKQQILEALLIKYAREFVDQGLDSAKQINNKLDIPGLDDEF